LGFRHGHVKRHLRHRVLVDPVAKLSVVMLTNVAVDTPFDRWGEAAIYSS
jgi:hypothetical protein